MRGLKLGILTATALALLPLCAAQAQQVININGVEATRVVIGPATSPLAQTIKSGLKDDYYNARAGTQTWQDAQKLYYFYGERNFEPCGWIKTAKSFNSLTKQNRLLPCLKKLSWMACAQAII